MYTLYGGRFTRAQIIQMLMAEAGIDYELVEIDILEQQHRSPEYLAINPAGYVPALRLDSGEVIHETHAINLYLIDRHRLEQLGPLPDDPQRGSFLSGLFFMADDIEPILKRLFYPQRYVLDEADCDAMEQMALRQVLERFEIIDRRLGQQGPYYLGERFSLVDIICSYWAVTLSIDSELPGLPAIHEHMALIRSRPLIKPLFDEMYRNSLEYFEEQKSIR
jgi:glutathione S-transferase